MSLVIHKYPVPVGTEPGISEITVPLNAWFVSFGQQNDDLFVWAVIDPETQEEEIARLLVVGTGHEFSYRDCGRFLGTAHLFGGSVVVHCFEAPENW